MSMSDTAEYWWRNIKMPYGGPDYFHIDGYDCGHRHLHIAKYIDQVNCRGCKKALDEGLPHKLLSKEQHVLDDKNRERSKLLNKISNSKKKYPNNPVCTCGFAMVERKNRTNGEKFFGCSNYPTCKNTQAIDANKQQ